MRALLLLLFVTFSFEIVPFALSSRMLPSNSNSSSDAVVVDVKGRELKLGEPYYALSGAYMQPEGLCLDDIKSENETSSDCPHNVVQCTIFYKSILGLPIIFSSADKATTAAGNSTTDDVVKENTSYKIQFAGGTGSSSCAKDTVWGLAFEHDNTCEFVTTDPGAPPVQFQLQKVESGYTIVYCETIPLPHIPVCFNIGFYQYGLYYSRLVVGLDIKPVEFFFVKKSNATAVQKHYASS